MGGTRIEVRWILFVFVVLTLLSLWPCIRCQDVDTDSYSQTGNPAVLPLITQVIYSRLSNLTTIFNGDITNSLGFCIKNVWVISDIPDFVSFWVWVSDNSLSLSLSFFSWGTFCCLIKLEILSVMLIGMGRSILVEIWISWLIVSGRQKVGDSETLRISKTKNWILLFLAD